MNRALVVDGLSALASQGAGSYLLGSVPGAMAPARAHALALASLGFGFRQQSMSPSLNAKNPEIQTKILKCGVHYKTKILKSIAGTMNRALGHGLQA